MSHHQNISLAEIERLEKIIKDKQESISVPPTGKFAVKNIYFNPANGRVIAEYDDEAN